MKHSKTISAAILFVVIIFIATPSIAQNLEIEGQAKISVMNIDSTADSVVVRQSDGTLAVREVSTFTDKQQITVSRNGDTLFLTNGGFVIIPGLSAANNWPNHLFCDSIITLIVDVTNPTTGKVWMDRNVGAKQVASSPTDADSYGNLFQWGRLADGHHCRDSDTTLTTSSSNQPGHGDFIARNANPFDWRIPSNDNLWQGENGVNNPCPSGYRLPTEAEWTAEINSWPDKTPASAFGSVLKLPSTGQRNNDGSFSFVDFIGQYWSGTAAPSSAAYMSITSIADIQFAPRVRGLSVRCIQD